jgi:hypothetical protein
MVLVL